MAALFIFLVRDPVLEFVVTALALWQVALLTVVLWLKRAQARECGI
ncbi:hypothetical protein ACS8Y6_14555 [Salinisphaera sp. RV14]